MHICQSCGQKISYFKLFFALIHVRCSNCDAKYKVKIKNYYIFLIMITIFGIAIYYTLINLTGALKVVAFVAAYLGAFTFAPFIQKLVSTSNKQINKD